MASRMVYFIPIRGTIYTHGRDKKPRKYHADPKCPALTGFPLESMEKVTVARAEVEGHESCTWCVV